MEDYKDRKYLQVDGKQFHANKVQREFRINQVLELLQKGKYSWEIVNQLSAEWQCNARNVQKYISEAYTLIEKHYDRTTVLENILTKYDFLYQKAIRRGDDKLAIKVLDSVCRITGLNKVDVTSNGETLSTQPVIINVIKPSGD
jgi:hypothetical protein